MYKRTLNVPERSFFLFGPRATGKTTWLKQRLPDALWFDLVSNSELLRLMRNPALLRQEVSAQAEGTWVVIDEVQKLPAILNEVQALIAEHGSKYRFALSGSSARKLKRLDANLLPGRVINRRFFPLTGQELDFHFNEDALLAFGLLPVVVADPEYAVDTLDAYVTNYLEQEIQQEAAARNIDTFARFLEVVGLVNGRVVNTSNIARDVGVSRNTVERYFEVLVATLIGTWLSSWRPRARVKETANPKFYLFDTGVARSVAGRLRDPLDSAERGPLLETLVLHELRAYRNHSNCGGKLHYWGTPSGQEVDFVWTRGEVSVGIEVKSSIEWRRGYSKVLRGLVDQGVLARGVCVYLGDRRLRDGGVDVLPLREFMKRLTSGEITGDL